ncbi:DUF4442 domain-containing protein [Flavobacterium covae]|uniref:DUF4442 domain-containing protein n=2 Tax=Flavobacterium TaxID=237 RepID=A0AA94F145_9FLAO|nr:DUF4442 domain-containing protein [Flavobacterium covae]MCH4828989.1 DUF4442 domain-containing protein [Flavobacterium columnare]AND65559.1 DUF4442 domain-containing protein [Flavobacterium covae]MCH4833762.1 DUF4442 domain-containing protein [Flavobacterium columnare]OWP80957.1 DUF4442 domain-containing protein [Flavobacterium covae]
MYQRLSKFAQKFIKPSIFLKYGFNLSPMYRRSTARVMYISENLKNIYIKIPHNYKNKNYVGSIFGGSLFSAVDPIPMTQLMYLLKEDYIVWDKAALIRFKKPARENVYATFHFSDEEINEIIEKVRINKEIEHTKTTYITNKTGDITFCEVTKTIYIAEKEFYKEKLKKRELSS